MIKLRRNNKGFTIIELLIATTIFSLVILVVTAGIIQIGRAQYRGVVETRTYDTARSMIDDVSQAIQFGGGQVFTQTPAGTTLGYCVGSSNYTYRLGSVANGAAPRAADKRQVSACTSGATAANLSNSGGRELLGESMRLVRFNVSSSAAGPGLYDVSVKIAYGTDDLFCYDGFSCTSNTSATAANILRNQATLRCKSLRMGGQFCAVSEINTTIKKRL